MPTFGLDISRYLLRCVCLLAVTCTAVTGTSVWGADPVATRVAPLGAQRGTEVSLTISGARLEDAEEIICHEAGLTFTNFAVAEDKKGNQVTCQVAVSADAPLGTHRLRVRTRSGLTKIVNFFVGAYPVIEEKEPNSEFTTPQPITNNVTVHGRIDNEDVDYFALEAKKGERLSVEIEGLRLGTVSTGSFFDPYIAVLNESRFELAACDDHALTRQDAFVSLIIPEDGTYYIQVRDASYGGGGNAFYCLHIGNYARPSGVVPAGGKPGETLTVKFLGDVAGDFEQQVQIPQEAPLSFGAYPLQNGLISPTPNSLQISDLENVIEVEPNETLAQATPLPIPAAANGVVLTAEDQDYFKFSMKKDQEVEIDVLARRLRSSIDSVVDVYNDKGGRIAGDDDRKRPDSWVRFKAPADGDYYVKVRDQLGNGGPDYFYRIEVRPISPALEITINEVTLYVQPDVVIPQGGRAAVLSGVKRENFGGAVTFTPEDLPPGVTLESPATWSGDGIIPLMFHSTAEAPVGSQFATIHGTWENPNNAQQKVTTKVQQHHLRIRANNNVNFWDEKFDVIPVVVAEKAPFDVKIVAPQVPIVRGGTMKLKVVATRDEGFDEPIQLLMLQNPPGVNSSRTIKIEKGQTEAEIPLNASGNAPLRESHITVRAIAKVGNGNIEVCTPYVPLQVAEKYMALTYVSMAAEQGQAIDFPIQIENQTEFEGTAQVELIGLPNKTSTEVQEITKESKEVIFPVKTEADAPVGETKNIYCKITVMENGEPVVHHIGEGRLRINKPAPQVVAAKPAPKPVEKKAETPKPKVLSRLEILRQQQAELRQAMEN